MNNLDIIFLKYFLGPGYALGLSMESLPLGLSFVFATFPTYVERYHDQCHTAKCKAVWRLIQCFSTAVAWGLAEYVISRWSGWFVGGFALLIVVYAATDTVKVALDWRLIIDDLRNSADR
ncbi:hypothetical protein [Methylorubrum extorquens]|uniref:hypothetical protein n=1 Tax=Methylorubrum extorquens TaxID=408 RepID=UPI0011BF16B6|nr:hypothetical protein [Methylorubrum extorquens]